MHRSVPAPGNSSPLQIHDPKLVVPKIACLSYLTRLGAAVAFGGLYWRESRQKKKLLFAPDGVDHKVRSDHLSEMLKGESTLNDREGPGEASFIKRRIFFALTVLED